MTTAQDNLTEQAPERVEKTMAYTKKIDFHSHFLTDTYCRYLDEYEGEAPDDFPTPKWSEEGQLKLMDQLGIAFSFLSISSPNLSKAEKDTEAALVHTINTEGAAIVRNHPDRFGLFAGLPLPHVEEAIREARYAVEELGADGFGLSTNYAGVYLGDPQYDPLMEYLDSIGAVIAIHPVKPGRLPKGVNGELPIPAMEFLVDTTRTYTYMVTHDIFERYPRIKWIFPHAGAFISILSDRMYGFAMQFRNRLSYPVPMDFKADMRRVYFDMAGFPINKQLHDLLLDVPADNLLYGSDAPYTPTIACIAQTGGLETTEILTEGEKTAMFTQNAVQMFPKLSGILGVSPDTGTVCYQDNPLTLSERFWRRIRTFISKVYDRIFA